MNFFTLRKLRLSFLSTLCTFFIYTNSFAQTIETIPEGSYIIDMGVTPQTMNNAIKPFGLVFTLLNDYQVPVKWIIEPTKGKDGIDFSHDGKDYRGGPFIIEASYRNATIDSVIVAWETLGVTGNLSTTDLDLPVAMELSTTVRWTLDQQNGGIAEAYIEEALEFAGITGDVYDWVLPNDLNCCNTVFVMPHADPEWDTHGNLYDWNAGSADGGCGGYVWAGCHAVSVLENMRNPANPSEQTNFLMMDPVAPSIESAIDFGDHDSGEFPPPYIYDEHDEPEMQFIGTIENAINNGSESIYLPQTGWRPTTKIGVYDSDHPEVPSVSPGPAALVAFGHAFGDPTRGKVMYEAGHSHNKGSEEENAAALRIFFNFSYAAMATRTIAVTTITPDQLEMETSTTVSASATGGVGGYKYEWSSACGGTFTNPYAQTTTYTAPTVGAITDCSIVCKITDDCGNKIGFSNKPITIFIPPRPPVAVDDYGALNPVDTLTVFPLFNDSDANNDPMSIRLLPGGTVNFGLFTDNNNNTITYSSSPLIVGVDSIMYEVCDTTSPVAFCDSAFIYIEVDYRDENGCLPSESFTVLSQGYGDGVTDNGNIDKPEFSLGKPDGEGTQLDKDGDPTKRGQIVIDLTETIAEGETILLYMASKDDNTANVIVESSTLGSSFSDASNFGLGTKEPNYLSYSYEVLNPDGIRYLRFTTADDIKEVFVDAVVYDRSDCILDCVLPDIRVVTSGNASAHTIIGGVNKPEEALGAPNNIPAEIDENGAGTLTFELADNVPLGTDIFLYLAREKNDPVDNVMMDVSGSSDGVTFSNTINYTTVTKDPVYTQFIYTVTQPGGVQFLEITTTNNTVVGMIDGVEYSIFGCEPGAPTAVLDSIVLAEDVLVNFAVQGNDSDPQNDVLVTSIVSLLTMVLQE